MSARLAALILLFFLSAAYPALAEDEIYVPTSAWLVGPALMTAPEGMEDVALPCVMANQYSNGYMLRLSGGGGKIMAMAVDFRQKAFTPGNKYGLGVSVAPDFKIQTKGEAYDEATLIVNLQKNPEFADAVAKGKIMTLDIARKSLDFAMVGVREGMARLDACYTQAGGGKAPAQSSPQQQASAVPRAPEDQSQTGMQTASFAKDMPRGPDDSEAAAAQGKEELGAMLENAAAAMASLEPAAGGNGSALPSAPQQQQAQSYPPREPPATAQQAGGPGPVPAGVPLAQTWAQPKLHRASDIIWTPPVPQQPQMQPPQYMPPQQPQAQPAYSPEAPVGANVERRWRAIKGMNLHELLDIWTRDVQARLIWQADEEYAIEESISLDGTLESAVATVLKSYNGRSRPVGRLYTDPATSQKVLLIETKSSFW